jgi:4-alpha-glucanotransferase
MHVMQWAFTSDERSPHRVENHRENGVVYTGTHDNDTTNGWWASLTAAQRDATGLDTERPAWSLLGRAYESKAALAIVPAQDVLGLGSEARMNRPGSERGNWRWRLEPGQLTDDLAARLRAAAEEAGRA